MRTSPLPERRLALLGLPALLLAAACARQEAPPGGEVDRLPPVVVAVVPEAFSAVEPSRDPIRIEFNERISERLAGGTLEDAVTVSPRTGDVRVEHSRDALEVEVLGGLQPGLVYRVTVRPVVRDMFNNTMREPFEFGFSTGGLFHETALAGLIVDRLTGRPLNDLVVRVVGQGGPEAPADSVVHLARTDSGVYTLRWLSPGPYRVVAFQDRNRDFLDDPLEIQGSREITLAAGDTAFLDFPVLEPDTTAALITRAEVVDSATIRLTFSDFLDPDLPLARVGRVLAVRETGGSAPDVLQLLHEHRHLAILAALDSVGRAADSLAADSLAADSLSAPPDTVALDSLAADTLAADTVARSPARPPARARLAFQGRAQGADSAAAALLGLTLPSRVLYAQLSDTLVPGVEYVLRIEGVVNLAGLTSSTDSALLTRAPPPPPPAPPGLETRAPAHGPPAGSKDSDPARGTALPARRGDAPPGRP
jgi:hypothetical protein